MTDTDEKTPKPPYHVGSNFVDVGVFTIFAKDGQVVIADAGRDKECVEFIVRACNVHDELVDAANEFTMEGFSDADVEKYFGPGPYKRVMKARVAVAKATQGS